MSKTCTFYITDQIPQSNSHPEESEKLMFSNFPFVATFSDDCEPHLSNIVSKIESFPVALLHLLQGIDWLINQKIDILSLSFKPKINTSELEKTFQIVLETLFNQGITVVVAAGNDGPEMGTLQVLAKQPTVISVGATDKNKKLLSSSSRGFKDGPQPTVVSIGDPLNIEQKDEWVNFSGCTSFATPRIANICAWIFKCLQLILGDLADQQNNSWSVFSRPIQLPVLGIPDTGVDPESLSLSLPQHSTLADQYIQSGQDTIRLSRSDSEFQWYEALVAKLKELKLPLQLSSTPDTVKSALIHMALPQSNYTNYEIGAGFVSHIEAEKFWGSLLPSRFIQIFDSSLIKRIPPETLYSVDDQLGPLWDQNKVELLRDLFYQGIRLTVAKIC